MTVEYGQRLVDDHILLVGRPPAAGFIRFVKTRAVNGQYANEHALAKEWTEARDRVSAVRSIEAGWADNPVFKDLSDDMVPIADAALQDPVMQRNISHLDHCWRLVEVDRLVVFQKYINLGYVNEIKRSLPDKPEGRLVIQLALGNVWRAPPIEFAQPGENVYSFSSRSNDLRFLDVVPLNPKAIRDYQPNGHATAAIAIYVGYGLNVVSAFHIGNRVILSNGSHRVYALRELGFTHVPCLVTKIPFDSEYDLWVAPEVKRNPDFYLKAPRPPVFKDYFDQRLRKIVQVPRLRQLLQVQLTFQTMEVPAM